MTLNSRNDAFSVIYQYITLLASLIYFWKGGSRDPKDPWIRPWDVENQTWDPWVCKGICIWRIRSQTNESLIVDFRDMFGKIQLVFNA